LIRIKKRDYTSVYKASKVWLFVVITYINHKMIWFIFLIVLFLIN
jgi:hypothetical protein